MIPRECKRLAEVDFPVAEVSRHSAREKSIRHGHPSTLHLWWARRPLAACRAMLMALLLPDPCDPHCPVEFREEARKLLRPIPNTGSTETNADLRRALLSFIADFANWDNSANPRYLECARGLVRSTHGKEPPLVVDPFAGGGSIPLEALRIGCDAFASDLNPVACLILKVMLEDIPRHGPGLADELRRVGKEIKEAAEKELAEFYPPDPDGARPIAYLWARTVRCEAPGCGAEIPLLRSFWLCKKAGRRRALRPKVVRPRDGVPYVEFEIFTPKSDSDAPTGTVARAKATCVACGTVLSPDRVRAQLAAERGGADVMFNEKSNRAGGASLLAVVTLSDEGKGRGYRLATERDYEVVRKAMVRLGAVAAKPLPNGLSPIPDEPLPPVGTLGFRVQRYGMLQWCDLFTARQKLEMLTFIRAILASTGDEPHRRLLTMALGRCADHWSANAMWIQDLEAVAHTFGRQALPIVWDFVEAVGFGGGGASFEGAVDWVARVVETTAQGVNLAGQSQTADACKCPLPDDVSDIWFTDPPYYDAVPYADLSDYFFVWSKRALPNEPILRDPFDPKNPLTPKCPEIVQDETKKTPQGRFKDKSFFEDGMATAFAQGRRVLSDDGLGAVVFAHKTTEGWEALLSGLLGAGWEITASWPITTERPVRLRSIDSAALAASVHLVCRPRLDAGVGGWEEILRELPNRIDDWMERLSQEGIRGADLVFSCIGPALELFSKYDKVETAEGREVRLDEFLEKVWEVVGRTALQQILGTAEARARNSAAGALEEDARLTALFLWTLQSTNETSKSKTRKAEAEEESEEEAVEDEEEEKPGKPKKGYVLIYDVARRFAQPLGIHLDNWEGRIIETKKGSVRLIPVLERADQLFGRAGAQAVAMAIERSHGRDAQFTLFPDEETAPTVPVKGRRHKRGKAKAEEEPIEARREATTLDRVHAAMLLQAQGHATALNALLEAEMQRGPDFLRLANALSALYPKDSEEKRLLDAMLLAVPRG